jgi:hypothetical protein
LMAELYEYAVIKSEKGDADGNVTDPAAVLVQPTSVLANDEEEVKTIAARQIPEGEMGNLDRIDILIRPFAGL